MSYSYKFRDKATQEYIDAFLWYEEQREGLGDLFETKFYGKLNLLCKSPLHYKASYKKYHEALIDTFPYLIVYSIDEKLMEITVISIFHTSRNPTKKFKK